MKMKVKILMGEVGKTEDFDALLYVQSIKLACHTLRAEEIKLLRQDFITYSRSSSQSIGIFSVRFLESQFLWGDAKRAG